jgi:hypothetical protein
VSQQVPKAFEVIPLLEREWVAESATAATCPVTTGKFMDFIEYHKAVDQQVAATLYRCALVQLKRGYPVRTLHGLELSEAQLKEAVGA